jgi:hypothetical protein
MAVSFQPNGRWFVFDDATGATLAKNLKTKAEAERWVARAGGKPDR